MTEDWASGVPDVDRALRSLLAGREPSGDLSADLSAAVEEAKERRRRNSKDGGAVLRYMHDHLGLTWEQVAARTGMSLTTAWRWAEPPAFRDDDGPTTEAAGPT